MFSKSIVYKLWLFSSRNTLLHNIHVVLLPICFLLKSNGVDLHVVFDVDFIDKGAGLVHITIGFAMLRCRVLHLYKYIMVTNTFNGLDKFCDFLCDFPSFERWLEW